MLMKNFSNAATAEQAKQTKIKNTIKREILKMTEAKKGIDVILLYRILKNEKDGAAWKMAFQTEHSNAKSRDNEAVPTKDGPLQNMAPIVYEFSATSIIAKGDTYIDELDDAFDAAEIIEIWEIDKAEKGTEKNSDKFKATYFQGYVSSFSKTSNSEDGLALEMEFAINGVGQKGYATLTEEQANVVSYVFKDTVKAEETAGNNN
ncbi:Phage tail protein [Brachybacterium faecium]|nr:Phage tail protein [Brachybacterium faecium]